ncbi:MAG: hypothetical protein L0H70_06165 [Xanthomonadales bacterium]|nr:hypothetical protein [Xanthomonadales bacterium]
MGTGESPLDILMVTTAEVMLALRAPGADWLATLITALDESSRDPAFDAHLRHVFAELAAAEALPTAVVAAAHRRTQAFSERLSEDFSAATQAQPVAERPRLTLVVG